MSDIMKKCRSKWFQITLQSLKMGSAHKITLPIKDFLSKCEQIHKFSAELFTFTKEILNEILHFMWSDLIKPSWQCLEKYYEGVLPSYRNQSIDLQSKSIEWFLYDSIRSS